MGDRDYPFLYAAMTKKGWKILLELPLKDPNEGNKRQGTRKHGNKSDNGHFYTCYVRLTAQ